MKRQKFCTMLMVLFAFAVIQSTVFAALTDGLVGRWPFDEGQGDVARDVVGGHDGVIERATWTTEAITGGWALQFDGRAEADGGIDSKVTISHSDDFLGADGSFSVSNWVNPISRGAMMDKSAAVNRMQWFILEEGPGYQLHWGAGPNFTFSGPAGDWNEWVHLVWSHSADSSVAYLNGEAVFEEVGMGPIIPTTEPLYFGDMGILPGNNPRQQGLEGTLDEIAIWNRALSADEVAQIFAGGGTAVEFKGKLAITWAAVKDSD